jgi:hypothetical protein
LAGCKDVVAVAIRSATGNLTVGPAASTRLVIGDRLLLVGEEDDLRSSILRMHRREEAPDTVQIVAETLQGMGGHGSDPHRGGQVEHAVAALHDLAEETHVADIADDKLQPSARADRLEILFATGRQVVEDADRVSAPNQFFRQVRADESGPARTKTGFRSVFRAPQRVLRRSRKEPVPPRLLQPVRFPA